MSWLLGSRYQQQSQDFSQYAQPPAAGSGGGAGDSGDGSSKNVGKSQMEAYRFDSSALERAAAAAKDLEKSPHAAEALALAKLQEMTKAKEHEASIEQFRVEQERIKGEERRKAIAEETKQYQKRAQIQDSLARKRYDEQLAQQQRFNNDHLAQQQRLNEENIRRQEESVAKQEALRKATIQHEQELKHKSDMIKLEAELKAKAKRDRENHDLTLDKIRLKAAEHRATVLESLSSVGAGVTTLLQDPSKILAAAGGLSLVALGFYTAKRSTGIASRFIEARLDKPSLIRETSRFAALDVIRHPIKAVKKLKEKPADALTGVVLEPKLEEKLRDVAIATKNTKKNGGMYRNMLLHGPPGTGKTLFAKKLAQHSGMDYAILSGADVAPLGKAGVTEIHKVFDWAETSRKGLVLFIDEAEGFLQKRFSADVSEDLRYMINAFLARTGEQSNKFMLVTASNIPDQFDWAIHNRLGRIVEFQLPGVEERERLIRLYFDKFVLQPATEGKRLKVAQFDYGALCVNTAAMTEGLSGRELADLALAWQTAAFTSADGVLTEQIAIDECLEAVKNSKQRVQWQSKEERQESKAIHSNSSSSRATKTGKQELLSIEPAPQSEKVATA